MEKDFDSEQCERILRSRSLTYWDVYAFQERRVDCYEGRSPNSMNQIAEDKGIAIRVVKNDKMGMAFGSLSGKSVPELIVATAESLARVGKTFPHELCPSRAGSTPKLDIYDKEVSKLTHEEGLKFLRQLRLQLKTRKFDVIYSHLQAYTWRDSLMSSQDLDLAQKQTFVFLEILVSNAGGPTLRLMSESHSLEGLDVIAKAEEIRDHFVLKIPKTKLRTKSMKLILGNQALAKLVRFCVGFAVLANYGVSGRSIFTGRLGSRVANESVSIRDEGLLPRGTYSTHFDGDGFVPRGTSIIESGKLVNYLTDLETSVRFSLPHTANCFREGYWSPPRIRAHNLVFEANARTRGFSDLISECREGAYIPAFSNQPHWDVNTFEAGCEEVYLIDHGRPVARSGPVEIAIDSTAVLRNLASCGGLESQLWGVHVGSALVDRVILTRLEGATTVHPNLPSPKPYRDLPATSKAKQRRVPLKRPSG